MSLYLHCFPLTPNDFSFKVANACSEYMRSNIMWSQSRLSTLPPSLNPASLMNGSKHHSRVMGDSLSPSSTGSRGANLPSNMSSLLQASAGRSLGQPPLLIPIHSMAYDVGLQLAATMSGKEKLLFVVWLLLHEVHELGIACVTYRLRHIRGYAEHL